MKTLKSSKLGSTLFTEKRSRTCHFYIVLKTKQKLYFSKHMLTFYYTYLF